MKVLFTHKSELIAAVLQESVTHVVIEYMDYIIHSAAKGGLQITDKKEFLAAGSKIVYSLPLDNDCNKMFSLFAKNYGSKYDFFAAAYIGFHFRARKLGITLPKANLWQSSGMYICTEWITDYIDNEVDSMITPYGLYLRLKEEYDRDGTI